MIITVTNTISFGGLTLGATDSNSVEWYWIDIDGWGATKSTSTPTQRQVADGAYASAPYLSYRTISISGAVLAPTAALLVAAQNQLNAAASIQPQTVTVLDSGFTVTVTGRRQDEILWKRTSDVSAEFTIVFLCIDPRKLGPVVPQSTGLPSSSGGTTFPITFPLTFTGVTNSGTLSINNDGNTLAPVKLRIAGPIVGPIVTHVGSGLQLVFSSSLTLNAGEWLDIDMEAKTVLAQGQSSRNGYVISRGWFGADPGTNQYAFQEQGGPSVGAQLTVIVPSGAWL
jgi:hypothetical protein